MIALAHAGDDQAEMEEVARAVFWSGGIAAGIHAGISSNAGLLCAASISAI